MNLSFVYSSDDNYTQHVGVSMISLLQNNTHFNTINIYLIENKLHRIVKNSQLIREKYNRTIQFINFNDLSEKLKINIRNSIAINSFYRCFSWRWSVKSFY